MSREYSKVVLQQMNNAEEITRAIHTHKERILGKMAEILKPYMSEEQYSRFVSDTSTLLELQLTYLEEINARMGAVDLEHSKELLETVQARAKRDASVAEVLRQIFFLKQALTGSHGEEVLSLCGMAGETPRHPAELERWLAHIVHLVSHKVTLPAPVIAGPAPWTTQHILQLVQPLHGQLREALDHVNQEQQEDKDTMTRKWQAMELQNHIYTAIAGIAECYARFTGEHELGERLRPRPLNRPSRKSKKEESVADTQPPASFDNSLPE